VPSIANHSWVTTSRIGLDPVVWHRFVSVVARSVWAMTSGDALTGHGMRLLHDALDALDAEAESGARAPGAAIGLDIVSMARAAGRLAFRMSQHAAAFDAAGGALAEGMPSTAAWIRHRANMAAGEARTLVRVGRDLRDRLPATAAAARDGLIGFGAACSISASLKSVTGELLAQADALLAEQAPELTPQELIYAGRRVLQHLDPDLAQRSAAQTWADRSLTLSPMLDGAVSIYGQLTAEGAAILQSALAPMTTPLGPEDTRTAAQRRADALVELVAKAAENGHAGQTTSTGLPPTLLVRMDIRTLMDLDPATHLMDLDPATAQKASALRANRGGEREDRSAERPGQCCEQGGDRSAERPGQCDERSAKRSGQCSARSADRSAERFPTGCERSAERTGGPRQRIPMAELDWGGPILAQTLSRIGCSAQLVRIVTDGRSRVLDLGSSRRLASPAQNLARAARDNGCVFPGCERPPEWTDAHHVIPWSQEHRTDLAGLASLCRFHHQLIHEGGWTMTRSDDPETSGWVFFDPQGCLWTAGGLRRSQVTEGLTDPVN
jgi:hypothetical protein